MSDYVSFGSAFIWDPIYVHKEKRDFEVVYKTAEKVRFRVGKTSFSSSYDAREFHMVTEINSNFNSVDASTLINSLKSCQSSQVVRGIVAYGSQVLLQEEVLYDIRQWIQMEFNTWSKEGRKVKWFVHINKDNKLFTYFRNYAQGLLYLHNNRFYLSGESSDLMITPEGLKIFKISYCPIGADFEALIFWNVHQFVLLFLACVTFPIWVGKPGPRHYQNAYKGLKGSDLENLGLSWEGCQALSHFELATRLLYCLINNRLRVTFCRNRLPAEAFLNHPIFYTPKEKVFVTYKINFELLFQNQKDDVIYRLNDKMKRRKDSWKVMIESNSYLKHLVGHCECSRMGCVDDFESGLYKYKVSAPSDDNHLFGDLCKVFHNALRHLDKEAIVDNPEPTPEDLFLYVEEYIPGGLTKIYGYLLYDFMLEIKFGTDQDLIEKRIKFLKTLV